MNFNQKNIFFKNFFIENINDFESKLDMKYKLKNWE